MRRLKELIVGTRYERLNTQEHVTSSRGGYLHCDKEQYIVIQGQNKVLLWPIQVRLMHTKAPVVYALPVLLLYSVLYSLLNIVILQQ